MRSLCSILSIIVAFTLYFTISSVKAERLGTEKLQAGKLTAKKVKIEDQYIIYLKVFEKDKNRETVISKPTIVTHDQQEASFQIGTQKLFVAGIKSKATDKGIVHEKMLKILEEGQKATMTITKLNHKHVLLDISIGETKIDEPTKKTIDITNFPKNGFPKEEKVAISAVKSKTVETRYVQCIELNKVTEFTISEDKEKKQSRKLKVVVAKIPAN